ncbi:MAG TPA: sigma-70 family RNA polymerase sigma factor [Actinomycetes bacterium]|jgi:RNA polymerase nonessential primary-like sigma factor|nr:sigma-70 family RNA polymerase sigma factor [Actinomycetes bacterium]
MTIVHDPRKPKITPRAGGSRPRQPDLDATTGEPDLVRAYLDEIGRVALLNAEQEVELAKRIEAGLFAAKLLAADSAASDEWAQQNPSATELTALVEDGDRARRHMLEANLRLVVAQARRYQSRGLPLLDLIQEGNLGLIRAIEKFDYRKGFKFSTYATWWIRQAIQRGLAEQSRTIRLSVHMAEEVSRLGRVRRDLITRTGIEPTQEEVAAAADIPLDRVRQLDDASRALISLDRLVGDDEETSFGDLVEDADAPAPEASAIAMEGQALLRRVLAELPGREAEVLMLRYGISDGQVRTLTEVGHELGLSRERVRQIERKALVALRDSGVAAQLRDLAAA